MSPPQYSPKVPCPPLESRPFELEQPQDIPDPAIPRPHGDLPPDEMIGEAAGTHSSSAKTFCPPTGTLTAEELEKRQLAYQKALDSETPRKGRYVPRRIPHQTPVLQPYFRWCTRSVLAYYHCSVNLTLCLQV